jgi:hypothetical protein
MLLTCIILQDELFVLQPKLGKELAEPADEAQKKAQKKLIKQKKG